jgi:hypothetical protein
MQKNILLEALARVLVQSNFWSRLLRLNSLNNLNAKNVVHIQLYFTDDIYCRQNLLY